MRIHSLLTAAAFAGLGLASTAALAEESGADIYMNACSTCHGQTGLGDGAMAEFMSIRVPNLTELAKNNDGEFPMLEVIQTIDGRTGLRGHGTEMPIWGALFKGERLEQAGVYASEIYARGLVLSVAYYLETIQAE